MVREDKRAPFTVLAVILPALFQFPFLLRSARAVGNKKRTLTHLSERGFLGRMGWDGSWWLTGFDRELGRGWEWARPRPPALWTQPGHHAATGTTTSNHFLCPGVLSGKATPGPGGEGRNFLNCPQRGRCLEFAPPPITEEKVPQRRSGAQWTLC